MGKLAGGSMVGFVGGGIAEGIVYRRECSDGGGVRKRRVVGREWLPIHEKGVAGEWRASCAQAEWHIREQRTASGYAVDALFLAISMQTKPCPASQLQSNSTVELNGNAANTT